MKNIIITKSLFGLTADCVTEMPQSDIAGKGITS